MDTSTLSHYLGPRAQISTPQLVKRVDEVVATDGARISTVTFYELERGIRKLELMGRGSAKRRSFNMFLSTTTVFSLDDHAHRGWAIAANLYATAATRSPALVISEGDLLILATALVHEHVLLTSDAPLAEHATALGHGADVELVALA